VLNTSTEVLIRPATRVFCSYRAAVAEYQAEGKYPDFDGLELSTLENMEHHVKQVRAEWGGPNAHLWWFVSGNEYLGRISLRGLSEATVPTSGQLGYDVRPGRRGRGHATHMVAALLPLAAELGMAEIITRVHRTNHASRRVHEANGAVCLGDGSEWLRYRLPTGPRI